jgi:hypothetical protein
MEQTSEGGDAGCRANAAETGRTRMGGWDSDGRGGGERGDLKHRTTGLERTDGGNDFAWATLTREAGPAESRRVSGAERVMRDVKVRLRDRGVDHELHESKAAAILRVQDSELPPGVARSIALRQSAMASSLFASALGDSAPRVVASF